ncbi:MAG: peptidoglycan bridge formation glycyltransferase FemA/FemB family protein [Pricia sp.]|nr:peptidoglycan bridge formation glycyltransferase FemA/FemB family protein [Pricia sp.]
MIEIITDREEWNDTINKIGHYDFYHTYYYHLLSKKDEETHILIVYSEGELIIALPLLLRNIPDTSYRDATSVYGYAGPICNTPGTKSDIELFQKKLHDFLIAENIISVFTRLHPYINYQEIILNNIGSIISPGKVVHIDLRKQLDIQRQQYGSRLKTYVNKARRLYTIFEGKEEKDIQQFMDMYHENMRRVNADEYYFFDSRYFYQLMISSFFKVDLLLCSSDETGQMIGGAMFIKTGDIVQYHLSCCKEQYLHLNPVKLLIDEMRIKATEEGYTYFNLGGGKGIKSDSLFKFKASFSKEYRPAKFWKYIVNEEIYEELVMLHKRKLSATTQSKDLDYFPAYRQLAKTT